MSSLCTSISPWLKAIKAGTSPSLDKAGDSAFIVNIKKRFALFLKYEPPSGSKGPEPMWGQEAAEEMFKRLISAFEKKEALDMGMISQLTCFGWLLAERQKSDVNKFRLSVVTTNGISASSTSGGKKRTSGGMTKEAARSIVSGLFKREG